MIVPCYAVYIPRRLFTAIRRVETGGERDPENAVGDGGASIGPYQIMWAYWYDAQQYDQSLTNNGNTYQNCKGAGSYQYSRRVIQAYMDRYATPSRLGHTATSEDIARIHNGGPNGYKNPNTLAYWQKVQQYL